jgi:hypothetical protein
MPDIFNNWSIWLVANAVPIVLVINAATKDSIIFLRRFPANLSQKAPLLMVRPAALSR